MTTTFDFGDGNGEVPAHRHINPDGSVGGWVAATAFTSTGVFIHSNAFVYGRAWVINESKVYGRAKVYDCAKVFNNATVKDDAKVYDKARVYGHAEIGNRACVYDAASVHDSAKVYEDAQVYGEADVFGNARVYGEARAYEKAKIYNDACVYGTTSVFGNKRSYGSTFIAQPTNVKTPFQQPKPLKFNTEDITNIKIESKKLSAMLNSIYEQDNQPTEAPEINNSSVLNLDDTHLEIVKTLATRPEWQRDELQKIMQGMMIDGVLEHINDAFFDYCDEAFIEGDNPIEINVKLYKEIFK